jgi:hypothetical protein
MLIYRNRTANKHISPHSPEEESCQLNIYLRYCDHDSRVMREKHDIISMENHKFSF